MNLIQNKEIYKILLDLDNIWITEHINDLLYMNTNEEEFEALKIAYWKYNSNNILTNFIENNKIYLSELEEKWYIKVIEANWEYLISFPILTDKWKIFLENYKNRNIFHKIQDFIIEYKILLWIISTIIWLIFIYIKLTN